MLTDGTFGFRYGYTVTDLNRTAPSGDAHNKLTPQAVSAGLTDGQTVQRSEAANADTKNGDDKYGRGNENNPDGKKMLKSDGTRVMPEEYYKQLLSPNKTDKNPNVSDAFEEKNEHKSGKHDGFDEDCPLCECETCKNRRYKDESDDSAVSFQQATKMSPEAARHKVKSHEMEHVRREQHKAKEEGKRVISQSVQIMTDVCPECGDTYVSGGLTRTTTKPIMPEFVDLFRVGAEDITRKGEKLNQSA